MQRFALDFGLALAHRIGLGTGATAGASGNSVKEARKFQCAFCAARFGRGPFDYLSHVAALEWAY